MQILIIPQNAFKGVFIQTDLPTPETYAHGFYCKHRKLQFYDSVGQALSLDIHFLSGCLPGKDLTAEF